MLVRKLGSTSEMAAKGAEVISIAIRENPHLVLGLATGSTQIRFYKELVRRYKAGEIDFSKITTFNLDEYLGMGPDYSHSYRYFMDNHFFRHVNLDPRRINMLDGETKNAAEECKDYEEKITGSGGLDLQVLGIGVNGHIAFCEPGTPFDSKTMKVKLDIETIEQNSDGRFYKKENEVPRETLTMGIKTVMDARKIVILANGPRKANAVKLAVEGPVTPDVPASVLQLHDDVIWLVENDAASLLD